MRDRATEPKGPPVRPARLLLVIAVAVFLLATAVWLMGNQWAEHGDGDWDAAALVVAGFGVLLLAAAGYASRRLASRSDG